MTGENGKGNGAAHDGEDELNPYGGVLGEIPAEILELSESCRQFALSAVGVELDYDVETLPILDEYLRQAPLDEPLPVVLAPSVASRCFAEDAVRQPGVFDAQIRPEWRPSLAAALDWRQAVRVHGVRPAPASRLSDLLELHHSTTGTPGLIEVNLAGPGEPVACTPRDAVRTVYSSAIDALVIGGFLLMKDYWLLRTKDS